MKDEFLKFVEIIKWLFIYSIKFKDVDEMIEYTF